MNDQEIEARLAKYKATHERRMELEPIKYEVLPPDEREQVTTCDCCNVKLTPEDWYRAYGAKFCGECFKDCTG